MNYSGSTWLRVVTGCFLFGVVIFSFVSGVESDVPFSGRVERIDGTVHTVALTDQFQKIVLTHVAIGEREIVERVLVYTPLFPPVAINDNVRFSCELERPEPFNGFRYDRFLAAKHIYATCFLREAPLVVGKTSHTFRSRLMQVRSGVIKKVDMLFSEPQASLLNGLLLGEQRFSSAWDERFQATGTTHIVAASGYNVSMVTKLVFAILVSLGLARPRAFSLLLTAIVAYVFLAGAEAPVVRAGVMGCLVLFSTQLGRRTTMTNVLLVSACVMLAFNPRLLRDDIGFQLSFVSTVALIYLAPVLESKFRFLPETYAIRENAVATISATLAALPILFLSFGQLSLLSPIANVLILPLTPYAMAFGAAATAVGFVSTTIAFYLSGPAWALLWLILEITRWLATVRMATIPIPVMLQIPLAVVSVVLVSLLWHKVKNTSKKR